MRKTYRLVLIVASLVGVFVLIAASLFTRTMGSYAAKDPHTTPTPTDSHFLANAATVHSGKAQFKVLTPRGHLNGQGHTITGIQGFDTIRNWNDHFFDNGYSPSGAPQSEWFTNTLGTPPNQPGTTSINAPIVPVKVNLLGPDGSVLASSDPEQYVSNVQKSPIFQNSSYSSSSAPTQFTDAVQRAEYYSNANPNWHTMLVPSVKAERTLSLPYGSWFALLNPDGTCCQFVLADYNTFNNALFPTTPTDTTTPIGAAENAGDITTQDISTFLFPNTYLYFNGDPNQCCVLGFHTFDFEPGDASNGNLTRAYVVNYSSWISPGLFGADTPDDAPQDVTALSHELSETFNDPLVAFAVDGIHDVTPWWMSSFNCQDNLEDGDVIEGLPRDNTVITMNGFNYHVQNEALLPWFEGQTPSSAINGAYSYPDTTTLTSAAVSQNPGCTPPIG